MKTNLVRTALLDALSMVPAGISAPRLQSIRFLSARFPSPRFPSIALGLASLAMAASTLACSGAFAPIRAQTVALAVGEEIRVRWNLGAPGSFAYAATQTAIGEVVDYNGATIVLRRGRRLVTVPAASVNTLERRVGTKPASAPAMVIGSGVGFLAGFGAGVLLGNVDPTQSGHEIVDSGISAGVLLGAPLGALFAWMNSRQRGIYEPVGVHTLVTGVVVDPGGRVGLSFSARRR